MPEFGNDDKLDRIDIAALPAFSVELCISQYWDILTPLTQYHRPVWLANVLSADNIVSMDINSLSQYSLIHDLAQNLYFIGQ